jgi:hypothetical protein
LPSRSAGIVRVILLKDTSRNAPFATLMPNPLPAWELPNI